MTELSGFWTTSGTPTGHQQSAYTQSHWSQAATILAGCAGFEGVAPGYKNKLAGTVTGANTVQIDTGGAVVDGKWYDNSAAASVNIPSATGAGNTRIDRIVLRANWAGFTVSVTRIAGTDATTPTAPAITQSSGTTYDIELYQALVDTSGTVTLTDERTFSVPTTDNSTTEIASGAIRVKDLGISSAKLAANAVIAGKLADGAVDTTARLANDIVDDTKVGNRVIQLYRRQGGSSASWASAGTTTQTPTTVRMQVGATSFTITAGNQDGQVTITFPVAFSDVPLVYPTFGPNVPTDIVYLREGSPTATNVVLQAHRSGTTGTITVDVNWIAIGPE